MLHEHSSCVDPLHHSIIFLCFFPCHAAESRRWIILPLHASLAAQLQDKVFDAAPEGVRKVGEEEFPLGRGRGRLDEKGGT